MRILYELSWLWEMLGIALLLCDFGDIRRPAWSADFIRFLYLEIEIPFTPADILTILTVPTRRKIRAYYTARKCNAIFFHIANRLFHGISAVPCDQAVDLIVVTAYLVRICAPNTYFVKNTQEFCLLRLSIGYDLLKTRQP